jgi:hypothetical protein
MPHMGELFPIGPFDTFTPDVIGTTLAGAATYAANGQLGRYVRIGNIVFVSIVLSWTAHTGTGDLRVTGLPFAAGGPTGTRYALQIAPSSLTYANDIYGNLGTGNDYIEPRTYSTGATTALIPMDTSAFMQVQGFYFVG